MRLPALKARDILAALRKAGFEIDHISGSHYILRHPSRPNRVTVPYHGPEDVKRAVVRTIVEQAGLTEEEFRKLL
ncbi:MAG: type II toxin-antitoxin system HicA family toxin [Chloroflexi bacterium]|nr:type II toxin-antitoxin system HicA family toxin [Chloroflexota bacterium]